MDQKKNSPEKINREFYERTLADLQGELVKFQNHVRDSGLRVIVLFEGRDSAGKGGMIKRMTDRVSPRVFRVEALAAPTDLERSQMYLQRYLSRFPSAGEVVLFDRSWYNRAGVEKVMGFCGDEEYNHFLETTPFFEKMIMQSGIKLIKYWLEIDAAEQTKRFQQRISDPRKIWKLSPMDIEAHKRWYDYSRARDAMFAATHTGWAPWYLVEANDKRRARLNCISHFLRQFDYPDLQPGKIELPQRQDAEGYKDPDLGSYRIEEPFRSL